LFHVIPEAFRIAASGRPGPVLIDLPKDVQTESVQVESWPEPGRADPSPVFSQEDVCRAADLINKAVRPVLCLGGGVINSGAGALAVRLADKASMPVATTLMGLGAVPKSHPLSLGMLGMHAARYTNMILDECDVLVAAGIRFDDRATGDAQQFCPEAKIVHIDIDRSELHKIKQAHVGIVGDVATVLRKLVPLIEPNFRGDWVTHVADLKAHYPLLPAKTGNMSNPYELIMQVADLIDEDTIVATDVGQHQMWTAQAYPFSRPRQWLTSGGLGTMGFGVPAAIGAALAHPDRRVVCFSGDGSLMMNIQELATAVEQRVNVKIIVMNNNCLGLVRQQQDMFYGGRIYASKFQCPVNFPAIAAGFGMGAFDLGTSSNPLETLDRALNQPGPCLIHAPINAQAQVYPMVPPGEANRHMIGGETDAYACA
jgi:acetolactate synthase-1/2/3 large subunit